MSTIDAIDSYFKYVKARIIAFNPSRTVVGIVEANDWPPKQVNPNSFYLLPLGESNAKGFGTATNRGLIYLVQWVWMIPGDNLAQNQVGRNRGDRYRINYAQMKTELLNGLYPGFCAKNTLVPPATPSGVPTVVPLGENIWWSPARWLPTRFESQAGLMYGAAQVNICSFTDPILQ